MAGDRSVFTRPFADALHQACTGRGLTQKQIGERIAVRRAPIMDCAPATGRS